MKLFFAALLSLMFSITAFAAVNANTATQQELESVKGIGPVKAKAIIDYRTKNGPFKSFADLEKVQGLGAKSLEKLKTELVVTGGSAKPAAKPAAAPATATAKPAAAKPATAAPATQPVKK